MENDNNVNPQQDSAKNNLRTSNNDDVSNQFENSDVDPGLETSNDNKLTSREDKRTGNIDTEKSVSEMREEFEQKQNDATNLNNDREHGSYNPKNI